VSIEPAAFDDSGSGGGDGKREGGMGLDGEGHTFWYMRIMW